MSLYNTLFGKNPFSGLLLSFLGTSEGAIPRFRDCFINEEGMIVIHTRTGGGNRDFYDCEERCRSNYPEYFNDTEEYPSGPWNADLRDLPGYLYDQDDDFDSTYADFFYKPDESVADLVKQLAEIGAGGNPSERWQQLFADMDAKKDSPLVARALEVGKPIIEALTKATSVA